MYLEILPRRTGKTTRLIEKFMEVDDSYVIPCYVTINMHMRSMINDEITKRGWKENGHCISQYEYKRFVENMRGVDKPIVFFYDEFDMMKYENIEISTDHYYATTPAYTRKVDEIIRFMLDVRNDALLELIHLNDGQYVVSSNIMQSFNIGIDDLKRVLYSYPPGMRDSMLAEIDGMFFSFSNLMTPE